MARKVIFLIGADDDVVLDPRLAERRRRARTSAAAAPPPAASRWAGRQSDEAIVACVGERFAELEVCVARTPEELLRSNAEAVVVISYLTQTSFAWYARFFDALRELEARGTKVYPSAAFKQLVSSKADYLLLLERTGLPVCPTRLLGQAALTEPATSSATDGSAGGSRADPVALEAALRSSLSELGLLSTREGGRPSPASRRYAPFQLVSKPSNADGGYGVAFWLGGGEAAAEGEAAVAEVAEEEEGPSLPLLSSLRLAAVLTCGCELPQLTGGTAAAPPPARRPPTRRAVRVSRGRGEGEGGGGEAGRRRYPFQRYLETVGLSDGRPHVLLQPLVPSVAMQRPSCTPSCIGS